VFAPATAAFTGLYILFGVAVIFGLASELYVSAIGSLEALWRHFVLSLNSTRANRAMLSAPDLSRYLPRNLPGWLRKLLTTNADEKRTPSEHTVQKALRPAWQVYSSDLLPTLVVGASLCLFFSAYVFTLVQPNLTYRAALWHCYISSTTVGYGDVELTTPGAMQWASVHILVSVSWLASFLRRVARSAQQRQWEVLRAGGLQVQLSAEIIAALETPASRAKGRGVNEVEFVTGMLITLGAQVNGEPLHFATHVRPLIERFHILDDDGSGCLTREDLSFMVNAANRAREQAPGLHWEATSDCTDEHTRLVHERLGEALARGQHSFTHMELVELGLSGQVHWDSCVCAADGTWYTPVAKAW
jgi:hypothetical protein